VQLERVSSRLREALARASAPGRARFPWARPRHELALLGLIAVVALLPLPGTNPQDTSRACLGEALLHGRVSDDECLATSRDYAVYGGHRYSDKAPGLSVLELPAIAVLDPIPSHGDPDVRLWVMRALTVGLALLGCVFLVGRVSEGLAPGYGAITMVTFGLGTIAAALAQISFSHVPAALAALAAFLLAWRRRPFAAGLAAGAGLLVEYQDGLILAVIGVYVAVGGLRPLGRYALGVLPAALLLAAYDWAAFGAPWRLSYRYVAPEFAQQQASGLFGIGVPNPTGVFAVFAGNGGLLFASPVLVLAAVGLVRLGRRFPAEAVVAGTVVILMLLVNAGYYLPYGGTSPGPRFFAPALPFLALGLPDAFAWRPRLTLSLAVLSVATTTLVALTWTSGTLIMRQTVWGEVARVPSELGSSRFVHAIPATLLDSVGIGKAVGVAVIVAGVVAAVVIAALAMPRRAPARSRSLRRALVVAAVVAALAAVDAGAILGFPYGNGYQPRHTPVAVHVSGSPRASYPGGMVNYRVDLENESDSVLLTGLVLRISLVPGMHLVGPPKVESGSGCSGDAVIDCSLDYLSPGQPTSVWFGIQFSERGIYPLLARVSSNGFDGPQAEYYVPVGE
jgi:hypothetical protein